MCILIIFIFYIIIVILIFRMHFSRIFGGTHYIETFLTGSVEKRAGSVQGPSGIFSIKYVWSIQEGFSTLIKKICKLTDCFDKQKIPDSSTGGQGSVFSCDVIHIYWRATVCLHTTILLLKQIYCEQYANFRMQAYYTYRLHLVWNAVFTYTQHTVYCLLYCMCKQNAVSNNKLNIDI